ncbi:hypothetical protein BT96DRAFT_914368 [Gymnopus androsaceus JB14]|uniref:Uncharacterized protein n=1 Tax=Gymnopus androsaceus JB14 TaxID=1447944 RepID=A0A6A4IBP2_9AGAR|nr:hypothetical protein BT96DRAFT_914368 [Gymnopus androsaceus JB14]
MPEKFWILLFILSFSLPLFECPLAKICLCFIFIHLLLEIVCIMRTIHYLLGYFLTRGLACLLKIYLSIPIFLLDSRYNADLSFLFCHQLT